MQVHRSIDQLPSFRRAAITIGTFDGVHLGHRRLLHSLKEEARLNDGESVLITFDPHPRKIVRPSEPLQLINSPEEKITLLAQTGIDHLVIVPFSEAFSNQPAKDYIQNFLIDRFRPVTIIIGYDHRFGRNREGGFMTLAENADQYGYRLLEIPKYLLDEIAVSSTRIREYLLAGNVDEANHLLGYPFFFEGKVVHGDKLGRTIGYPTANLEYIDADKIHLGHGVFAVDVHVEERVQKGMLSIGTRPTLTDSTEKVEVNIFDWTQEIYGKRITVTVKKFLRRQEKYAGLEELKAQLALDKQNSLRH